VVAGNTKVTLSLNTGTAISVSSTGSAFSTSVGDIQITAESAGVTSDPFTMTTRAPQSLDNYAVPTNNCNYYEPLVQANLIYSTLIPYRIIDTMGDPLPSSAGHNEAFGTRTNSYTGNDWDSPSVSGGPEGANAQFAVSFR
jgi:hypothetical protein